MSSDHDEDIDWNKVMEKEAMGENGLDLGTIKQIEEDYIITEMGGLTKKRYKLPRSAVKSFNGVFLNFLLNESDASALMLKEDNINEEEGEEQVIPRLLPGSLPELHVTCLRL